MTRDERIRALIADYGIDQQFRDGEADRFAVVGTGGLAGDDIPGEKVVRTYGDRSRAYEGAGDMILDGYGIDGIVDLDDGTAFGVTATVTCEPVATHSLTLPWEA